MLNLHHDRIQTAASILRPKAHDFLDRATKAGYRILVVRTWERTQAQWLKFQQGRKLDRATGTWEVTDPAKVVTNALPGQTAHNVIDQGGKPAAMGLDIIPIDLQDQPLWGLPDESVVQLEQRWGQATGRTEQLAWADLYRMASKAGLDAYGDEWGAVWTRDKGHLEEPAWELILPALELRQPTWVLPSGV